MGEMREMGATHVWQWRGIARSFIAYQSPLVLVAYVAVFGTASAPTPESFSRNAPWHFRLPNVEFTYWLGRPA